MQNKKLPEKLISKLLNSFCSEFCHNFLSIGLVVKVFEVGNFMCTLQFIPILYKIEETLEMHSSY